MEIPEPNAKGSVFSGDGEIAKRFYNILIDRLIVELDEGSVNKHELAWIYEYCLKLNDFKYEGISNFITIQDADPSYDINVRNKIQRTFNYADIHSASTN